MSLKQTNESSIEVMKVNSNSYADSKETCGAYDMKEDKASISIWNDKHNVIIKMVFEEADTGAENIIIEALSECYLERMKEKNGEDNVT